METLFEKARKRYLKIYAPVIPENAFDPALFNSNEHTGGEPKLTQAAFAVISSDIMKICDMEGMRVKKVLLTGPALGEGHRAQNSEVTVLLILEKNLLDGDLNGALGERVLRLCKMMSHKLLPGTRHPVVYVPHLDVPDLTDFNGVYDLQTNTWLQHPVFRQ